MQGHKAIHGEFTIERNFNASLGRVYDMFSEIHAKELWFKGPDSSQNEHRMDFRVGGSEFNSGKFHDGITHVFKGTYYDIVPKERIVYTYEMYLNDDRISVSLATIEFSGDENTTKLVLHESGVFLDGFDKPEVRELGTNSLLDTIENALNQ